MESSSVWYRVYRFITDVLGYKVVLSNPYLTRQLFHQKKDRQDDAGVLPDLLRGGYIATCLFKVIKL